MSPILQANSKWNMSVSPFYHCICAISKRCILICRVLFSIGWHCNAVPFVSYNYVLCLQPWQAAEDALQQMGSRKFLDLMMEDAVAESITGMNSIRDAATPQDYIKVR